MTNDIWLFTVHNNFHGSLYALRFGITLYNSGNKSMAQKVLKIKYIYMHKYDITLSKRRNYRTYTTYLHKPKIMCNCKHKPPHSTT